MNRVLKYGRSLLLSALFTIFLFCLCACSTNSDGNIVGGTLKEGITLSDIVSEINNQIGIQMPGEINDQLLVDLYYMDMNDVEAYSGQASLTMTSCDTVLGIKAVPGHLNNVVAALEKRQQDLINSFAQYLPEQYAKAQAGEIIVRGDYAFLVVVGTSEETLADDMAKAQTIIDSYFK